MALTMYTHIGLPHSSLRWIWNFLRLLIITYLLAFTTYVRLSPYVSLGYYGVARLRYGSVSCPPLLLPPPTPTMGNALGYDVVNIVN